MLPVHNSLLLRSLWSIAAVKSCPSSSSFTANYPKPLLFSRSTGFTRLFFPPTATATSLAAADASNTVVHRNVAVISQVDHGKTKPMDWLLRQCGGDIPYERALDSITLERERGITISSEISLAHSASSQVNLEESIREAVEAKAYTKIPDLLNASKKSCQYPNPFLFLSTFSESHKIRVIDDILQSFISLRPRFRPHLAYSSLLSYTLEGPNSLPLTLAIMQRMLRSGCLPAPQTHLTLSKAWLDRRKQSQTIHRILSEMNSIGYSPDCGTCNYLILSLCKVDHIAEAAVLLSGMGTAGCIPDLDSYGTLIGEMSELRMTNQVVEIVKEMVGVHLLNPRKETVVKAVNAMRANREIWRAVEMIEFLESEGVGVGFEAYESVLEGCLEVRQFVLAGKFVVRMTERGFIPYIRVRQWVFDGLVTIGETKLASVVRQRFAELKS